MALPSFWIVAVSFRKRKRFDLGLILERLSEDRKLSPDGSISYKGFGVREAYVSFLTSAVETDGLTDAFVSGVVGTVLNDKQRLSEEDFIKACNRLSNIALQKKVTKFKVIFPLLGNRGLLAGRRVWGDVSINFEPSQTTSFSRKAKEGREQQIQRRLDIGDDMKGLLLKLPWAVCSASGVDASDAFEKAEAAISKELGLHSVIFGRGKYLVNNGPVMPISDMLLAPHMTVHNSKGEIFSGVFWSNPWPAWIKESPSNLNRDVRIRKSMNHLRASVRKLPWRDDAEMALARHYSAFGQFDLEASFLDGWRLLERVGGHTQERGETLVKRAAWFFEDRDFYVQIGRHLLERRNLLSHGRPVRDQNQENLAFQVRDFISPILMSYLTNPFGFRTIDEFWDFCDMPVSKSTRQKRMKLLQLASKFRSQ